jgi:hypothetical protein
MSKRKIETLDVETASFYLRNLMAWLLFHRMEYHNISGWPPHLQHAHESSRDNCRSRRGRRGKQSTMACGKWSHLRHARDGEAFSKIFIGCSAPQPPGIPFQSAANSLPVSRAQPSMPMATQPSHSVTCTISSQSISMLPWVPWRIRLFPCGSSRSRQQSQILLRTAVSCLPSHDELSHPPPTQRSGTRIRRTSGPLAGSNATAHRRRCCLGRTRLRRRIASSSSLFLGRFRTTVTTRPEHMLVCHLFFFLILCNFFC